MVPFMPLCMLGMDMSYFAETSALEPAPVSSQDDIPVLRTVHRDMPMENELAKC